MCGRYTQRKLSAMLFGVYTSFEDVPQVGLYNRFNIAPSQDVPVVRLNKDQDRKIDLIRWGLIPSWTKEKPKLMPVNARAETVATSGMFRQAFARRRCLQIADGFYEWKKLDDGTKQPYFIKLASDAAFAFAGIWERWKPDPEAEPVDSVCHITTEPNELMAPIHNRMPVILKPEDYELWLNKDADLEQVTHLLRPFPAEEMMTYAVTKAVGSPRNDSPENVIPI